MKNESEAKTMPKECIPGQIHEQIEAEKRKLKMPALPSRLELAQVTASLVSAGLITHDPDPDKTIREALRFLDRCEDALAADHRLNFVKARTARLNRLYKISKPHPKQFPITFTEFLKLRFSGKSEAERIPMFRKYLIQSRDPCLSKGEVADCIAGDKARPIELVEYLNLSEAIEEWKPRHRSQQNAENASK